MQSVSFWQAWGLWFDGQSVSGYRLWGLPVLWWGRFGKLGQFTGGLVAIIDIVGVTRIAAWGDRLRARPVERRRRTLVETWRRKRQVYRDVYQIVVDDARRYSALKRGHVYRDGEGPPERVLEPEARRVKQILTFGQMCLLGAWVAVIVLFSTDQPRGKDTWAAGLAWYWWPVAFVGWVLVRASWYWILMAILLVLSMTANLLARAWPLVVYGLFVFPPLLLLRGPQPDRSLRVIGVLLVVTGFAFDLLAS